MSMIEVTSNFITIFYFFLLFLIFFVIGRKVYLDKRREAMVKNFANYTAVLDYHMNRAYEIIHKDKMLIYSIEATKLPEEEFNAFSKEFIRLVEKLLGKMLIKEFVFLYGSYDTFIFNVVEYFNSRYETDEIRQTAMANVMESEIEVPESLKP